MNMSLRFLGASGTVTGSKYLLTYQGRKVLIDCGLFQGLKELRLKNWTPPDVDPKTIDAIVLTHAHIDHSGYIPRLIKEGFRGKVYCTPATLALCRILLPDTGYLLEEEAEYMNRKHVSKHHPALALFTKEDAERALKSFVPRNFHENFEAVPGVVAKFLYAGHILGAACAALEAGGRKILFSGDVGRPNDPIFRAPEKLPPFDYLVVESTYGDRAHLSSDPKRELGQIVTETANRKGVVLIPAFAVGRSQTILHFLAQLKLAGEIPDIPIYLNSPMSTDVTNVFFQFANLHKLSPKECEGMREVVRFVKSADESKALNMRRGPMVIISASGMATGGRILHHLKEFAPGSANTIVLAGFQAAGTRGRSLQDGAKEIKIHGGFVPVNAEVRLIENLSAHADASEILEWLERSGARPRRVFVTHGEPSASAALASAIQKRLGWESETPAQGNEFPLE